MIEIDIALCTFRRQHIAATLHSLARLEVPPDTTIRIIVADNDDTPSAKALVEQTARETGLTVLYLHAPARNISIARNACLAAATAPLFAFVDDDELATPGWLKAMLAELEASKAEAVLGPVHAIYRTDAPAWMVEGNFHATEPVETGGQITTGYSCNVLFHRTATAFSGLRFKEELGRSGGEDTVFFAAAHRRGARLAFAAEAVVTEAVPPARADLRWLLKRRFRAGQTHVLLGERGFALMLKASLKILFCYWMASISLIYPLALSPLKPSGSLRARYFARASADKRLMAFVYWLLRGTLHLGVVCRLAGLRELTPYG